MEKILFLAFLISGLFFVTKLVERRYLDEVIPLKYSLRDAVYVFLAGSFSLFIMVSYQGTIDGLLNTLTGTVELSTTDTQVFTGNPDF
jgi:hypothetical protein